MRTWCIPCVLAFGLLAPRPCLAQAADDARREQEMQEDVEVLRRIVTESVQKVYQEADQRVTRSCATCHQVASLTDLIGEKNFDIRGHLSGDAWDAGALNALHAHGQHWAGAHGKQAGDAVRVSGLANYIAGHGIVVQMEAPAPVVDRDVKAWVAAEEAAPKRWERLLRETRGEPEKNPAIGRLILGPEQRRVHRLILTEKVLEVLADNGRNLRHLTPDERVTIAFTFRSPTREEQEAERRTLLRHYFPDASSEGSGMMGGMGPRAVGNSGGGAKMIGGRPAGEVGAATGPRGGRPASDLGSGAGPRGLGAAGPGGSGPAAGLGAAVDESPSLRTSAVAGDLLLRQERYTDAIAAYEKALKESGIDTRDQKTPLPADAAEVVRKLAQAYVGAKNGGRATDLLQWLERSQASASDETTALRRIYLDLTGVPPTPEDVKTYLNDTRPSRRELLLDRLLAETQDEGPARVPARMTISCTRKQLEDAATGKLSKLDFANQVTLKYYKAAPAAKRESAKN